MVNGIRRMGGFGAGLVMASLLGAGMMVVEPPRRRVMVIDDEPEAEADEKREEPKVERRATAPEQPSAQAQRAMTLAKEKRARKNARRLSSP